MLKRSSSVHARVAALVLVVAALVLGAGCRRRGGPSFNPWGAAREQLAQAQALQAQTQELQAQALAAHYAWRVRHEVSAMDGSPIVHASKYSRSTYEEYGDTYSPSLVLRCEEGRLRVGVVVPSGYSVDSYRYERDHRYVDLDVSVDRTGARTIAARLDSDRSTAWVVDPAALVGSLRSAGQIAVRVVPSGMSALVATFELEGIDEPLSAIGQACALPGA